MSKGIGWVLGDGKRVRFWKDIWLDLSRRLVDYATLEVPKHLVQLLVCDVVDRNGQWAWDLFQHFLSLQTLVHIVATKPPLASNGDDEMYRKLSNTGKFTVASAFNLVAERVWLDNSAKWKVVWD